MEWPLVTIAITAYNYAHMIRSAIESAQRQTYPHLEILILDNASTDDTQAVLAEYAADPRVRCVRHPENIGMAANHNAAIDLARGEYLTYLSADDMMLPDYVMASFQFLQANPLCNLAYSGVYLAEKNGHIVARRWRSDEVPARHLGPSTEFARLLADGCWIYFASVFTKRVVYRELGGFEDGYVACDYDLLLRWTKAGIRIGDVGRTLTCARLHADCRSGSAVYGAFGHELGEFLDFLEKHVGESDFALIDGFEYGVVRRIGRRITDVKIDDPIVLSALQTRVLDAQDRMRSIAAVNYVRPVKPVVTYIIVADGPLNAVEATLRSVMAQQYDDWEAIVVSTDTSPIDEYCAYADRRGRVRGLSLVRTLTGGRAVAAAVRIARGNAFVVLRSGAALSANHAGQSCTLLESDPRGIVMHPARLLVVDKVGSMQFIDDVFPQLDRLDVLPIAPVVPIESLVLTRRFLDRYDLEDRGASIYNYWGMLLAALPATPVLQGSSSLAVTAFTETRRDLSMTTEIRDYAQTLYDETPQRNARIAVSRRAYIAALDQAIQALSAGPHDVESAALAHRAFCGTGLLDAQAVIA